MTRNPAVVWVGTARRAALAVPCPTCNATIGQECEAEVSQLPHRERTLRAEVFGFRDVAAPGPLFQQPAPSTEFVRCTPEEECSDPGSQYCRCHRMIGAQAP